MTTATQTVDTFDVVPESYRLQPTAEKLRAMDTALGMVQARRRSQTVSQHTSDYGVRYWELSWRNATPAQEWRIRDLMTKSVGGSAALQWTEPVDADVVAVHIVSLSPITRQTATSYSFSVLLMEII